MMQVYKIALSLKYPTDLAKKLNMLTRINDIESALKDADRRHKKRNMHYLRLSEIKPMTIYLLIQVNNSTNSTNMHPCKHIQIFNDVLVNKYNWGRYVSSTLKKRTRLFSSSDYVNVTDHYPDGIEDLPLCIGSTDIYNLLPDMSMQSVLGFLLDTRHIGDSTSQEIKERAIKDIKAVLVNFI